MKQSIPFLIIFSSANCDANPTFKPVASGGDGAVVQYWFVGYDLTLQVHFGVIFKPDSGIY